MANKHILQYVLLGASILVATLAMLVFAGIIQIGKKAERFGGQVLLWGTVPEPNLRQFLLQFNQEHEKEFALIYRYFPEESFDTELVEAIAASRGPDLVLLPEDLTLRYEDKIYLIPFDAYPRRTFQDTFAEEGELFVTNDGILALPFYTDPLVLYWNRDLFSSAGIALPPAYWDELLAMAPRLSVVEERTNIITRSAIALGEAVNIPNAKAILSTLFLQAGDSIVERNEQGQMDVTLGVFRQDGISAAQSSLRFYTEFANPSKQTYSWNRVLPEAQRAFTGNQSAMYLGFASELEDIRTKNSHLNFKTAVVPQIRGSIARKTFSHLIGVAALRSSGNLATAVRAMFALSGAETSQAFADAARVVPARRDLLSAPEGADADQSVFAESAIIGRGWLDPVPSETHTIFKTMIEGVTSGREREADAVSRANRALQRLIDRQ